MNKLGIYPRFGDVCSKCGYSSCDHNEDPVNNCPGTVGNPSPPNPANYHDGETSLRMYAKDARIAALTEEVARLNQQEETLFEWLWQKFDEPGSMNRPLTEYRTILYKMDEVAGKQRLAKPRKDSPNAN